MPNLETQVYQNRQSHRVSDLKINIHDRLVVILKNIKFHKKKQIAKIALIGPFFIFYKILRYIHA